MNRPLISIILPTFNSERFLEKCLQSIRNQTYTNIEIIVIDNYSSDKTKAIAKKYAKVISHKGLRSEARNIGTALAKGDFFLSVDSDMELSSSVLNECFAKAKLGFDAIVIPEFSVGKGFWAKCKALEKKCYIENYLVEAARFFSREKFEEVKGYDVSLEAGEDWDIHLRYKKSGFRIGRIKAFIKHMEGNLVLRESLHKKYLYGKTFGRYIHKHPDIARKQLGISRLLCFRNWKSLIENPQYLLGLILMKSLEFVLYEAGRLTAT